MGVDKGRPHVPDDDVIELVAVFDAILRNGRLTQGDFLRRFEEQFGAYVGVPHAVGMSSGTAPLEIALRHYGVAEREVIVPTNTFAASANAVLLAGGTPVFADLDPDTLCSGRRELEARVTANTAGIVVVHLAGLVVPDIDEIVTWCRRRSLFVIEDAAHAHGSSIGGRQAGSLGNAGSFSFYPSKVITCGEGGMLTTADSALADFARSFRSHGQAADSRLIVRLGSNYRMPEMSAALGLTQLRRLPELIERRTALAEEYRRRLSDIAGVRVLNAPSGQVSSYYRLPIVLPRGYSRETVAARLAEMEISSGSIYWPPCHLQPFFQERLGSRVGDLPTAEEILARTLTLPLHTGMGVEQVRIACQALQVAVAASCK